MIKRAVHKILPPKNLYPAQPHKDYAIRMLIDNLLKTGQSHHSGFHGTLAYLLDFCERCEIQYILKVWPKKGYWIDLVKKQPPVQLLKIVKAELGQSAGSGIPLLRLTLKNKAGLSYHKSYSLDPKAMYNTVKILQILGIRHTTSDKFYIRQSDLIGKSLYCRLISLRNNPYPDTTLVEPLLRSDYFTHAPLKKRKARRRVIIAGKKVSK